MKKVSIDHKRYILDDVFKVEEAYLRYEKFNGEMSNVVRRICLERGDTVAAIVVNQITNKILLISQFRYPTYKTGQGWSIETITGIIDPGESLEEAAGREVQEVTGLTILSLEHITSFYPSPGGSSERVHLYYVEVTGENVWHNLILEGEDIKALEFTLEEALGKIRSGEIMDAKTIIGIYWLENQLMKKTT